MISLTLNSNATLLEMATNLLAFLGLIFDVFGTLLGVCHIAFLQHVISYQTSLLLAIEKFQKELMSLQVSNSSVVQPHVKVLDLATKMKNFAKENPPFRFPHNTATEDSGPNPPGLTIVRRTLSLMSGFMLTYMSMIPLAMIAHGIFFLLLSVILLAAQRLPRAIWVICLSGMLGIISISCGVGGMYLGAQIIFCFPSGPPNLVSGWVLLHRWSGRLTTLAARGRQRLGNTLNSAQSPRTQGQEAR